MNAQESLGLLDAVASRTALTREDHGKVIEATRVLHLALVELGNLRQEVDRLQAEIERLQPDGGGEPAEAE